MPVAKSSCSEYEYEFEFELSFLSGPDGLASLSLTPLLSLLLLLLLSLPMDANLRAILWSLATLP